MHIDWPLANMVYDYKYRVLGEQDVATFSYSDSLYLLEKGSLYIPHNIYKSATIVFNEKGLRMRFFGEYYIDIFFGALWAVSSFLRVLPGVAFAVSNRAGRCALAALGSQWSQNWNLSFRMLLYYHKKGVLSLMKVK